MTPESHSTGTLTIQDAVDQVKATGGTVCLAAGVYDLGDGVDVDGARSLRIRGQGPATILVARGTALTITAVDRGHGREPRDRQRRRRRRRRSRVRSVVAARRCRTSSSSRTRVGDGGRRLRRVELSGVGAARRAPPQRPRRPDAASTPAAASEIGLFAAGAARRGQRRRRPPSAASTSAAARRTSTRCRVDAQRRARRRATAASSRPAPSRPAARSTWSATRSRRAATGIVVGADATVDSNVVNTARRRDPGTDGIVVAPGAFAVAPGHVRITGNRVHDRAGTGIALRTPVRTFMVKQNVVTDVGAGIAIEGKGSAERVAVDNNEIFDVAAARGQPHAPFGILLLRADVGRPSPATRVARVGLGAPSTPRAGGDRRARGRRRPRHRQRRRRDRAAARRLPRARRRHRRRRAVRRAPRSPTTRRASAPAQPAPTEGTWNALMVDVGRREQRRTLRAAARPSCRVRRRRGRADERLGLPRRSARRDHAG